MTHKLNISMILVTAIVSSFMASAEVAGHKVLPEHVKQAEELVSKMTLQEKIEYVGGIDHDYIKPIPRLGIPKIKTADGPQGIRHGEIKTISTSYPSVVTTTASWDRELIKKMGIGLGKDAKARGVHILLGPAVNIYRGPYCGRNFEYMGEDPFLASEMALNYIDGVQSQEVMTCIKHFACNNQDFLRHTVSSDLDMRTLYEIYFPTFEKAVKNGVATVMCSYNLLNSVHSSENPFLLRHVLRDQWGFKGFVISDWRSTYSPLNVAMSGLDLEMPRGIQLNPENLIPLIENGILDERYIDEKCVNILSTLIAWGILDPNYKTVDPDIPLDNPENDAICLDIARGAMTLLLNENSFLPKKRGSFFICGPHADTVATGSGAGNVIPFHAVSIYEGMKSMGGKVKASVSAPTKFDNSYTAFCYTDKAGLEKGIKSEYFNGIELKGKVLAESTINEINFNWGKESPYPNVPKDRFSARYTFYFIPETDEFRTFKVGGDDGYRLRINGKIVCGRWAEHGYATSDYSDFFRKGQVYKFEVEYYDQAAGARLDMKSCTCLFGNATEEKALANAECAVVCLGFNGSTEGEDFDRTFELPSGQASFIREVASVNPNVVVIVNGGGAFETASWLKYAKALIWAGYPGQEGGRAIAEILSGKICPSGRLPFSFEAKPEDSPTASSYGENVERVRTVNQYKRIQYNEGLFLGYRGYDRSAVKALFPFGYGLSYTTFEYSDMSIKEVEGGYEVSFNVKNNGPMDGSDVAQVYVSDLNAKARIRPVKELKGFTKIKLRKGETSRISVFLEKNETFREYDLYEKCFKILPGEYEIHIGRSSEEIVLSKPISL